MEEKRVTADGPGGTRRHDDPPAWLNKALPLEKRRKLLDRAKGILMDEHKLGEAEAYRRIQVQSMNLRKTMREVAEAIILAKSI